MEKYNVEIIHCLEKRNAIGARAPREIARTGETISIIPIDGSSITRCLPVVGESETSIIIPYNNDRIIPTYGEFVYVHTTKNGGITPPERKNNQWFKKNIVNGSDPSVCSIIDTWDANVLIDQKNTTPIDIIYNKIMLCGIPVVGYTKKIPNMKRVL